MVWSMKRFHLALFLFALLFGAGPICWILLSWNSTQPVQAVDNEWVRVNAGEVLFKHEWQPNDRLSPGGDGLGPVFNARSCVACHQQNGPGGSGGLEHNVTNFVMRSTEGKGVLREGVIHNSATAEMYQETLTLLDPSLPALSGSALAKSGLTGALSRDKVVMMSDQEKSDQTSQDLTLRALFEKGIQLSQRKTPALFGAGLIDGIADLAILIEEQSQHLEGNKGMGFPVGRAHRLPGGKVGRFGWKAQTARLSEFVQAACANELGLSNPGHPQPQSLAKSDHRSPGLDLTQLQCDQLTAYVASLPRPMPTKPHRWSPEQIGKNLFTKIGCADCHTPNLGSVEGLYSDLLLHSMGQGLAGAGSSYGGRTPIQQEIALDQSRPRDDEWRTPPLWAVADSAPYMHDGRAGTLEEAIRVHGGQAAPAAHLFQSLKAAEQRQVIAFLRSLKAPGASIPKS
jgi:CxxC motif-containing protein (DUF1111 family)